MKEGMYVEDFGIDANIKYVGERFPKEVIKFMKLQARELAKHAKKVARSRVKRHTGDLFKSIRAGTKVYSFEDAQYVIRVYYKNDPGFYGRFIEIGHSKRNNKGFVQGYNILNDSVAEFEGKFEKAVEDDLVDFVLEALGK